MLRFSRSRFVLALCSAWHAEWRIGDIRLKVSALTVRYTVYRSKDAGLEQERPDGGRGAVRRGQRRAHIGGAGSTWAASVLALQESTSPLNTLRSKNGPPKLGPRSVPRTTTVMASRGTDIPEVSDYVKVKH